MRETHWTIIQFGDKLNIPILHNSNLTQAQIDVMCIKMAKIEDKGRKAWRTIQSIKSEFNTYQQQMENAGVYFQYMKLMKRTHRIDFEDLGA